VITSRTCEQSKREFCFIAAHDARPAGALEFYSTPRGRAGRRHLADMPVDERAAALGSAGSYDPKRKLLYWASPIRTVPR